MHKNANEIVLFESSDEQVSLPVSVDEETVWLTKDQMAMLFDRDRTVITRHISNVYKEGELEREATCAKFAQVQVEGNREVERTFERYNLDVIISVGYRVKSRRGVEFRRWATSVLREYIMKGHAENRRRLEQLGQIVDVMDRVPESLGAADILSVVKAYTGALDLLDDYDHQRVAKPQGSAVPMRSTFLSTKSAVSLLNSCGSRARAVCLAWRRTGRSNRASRQSTRALLVKRSIQA